MFLKLYWTVCIEWYSLKNIEIRAQEKGYLEKVYVDEGQYVHAGQPLFKTMASLHQVDLLKAQAEAKAAEKPAKKKA